MVLKVFRTLKITLAKCERMNNDIPHLNDVLLELSPFFCLRRTQSIGSLDEEAADKVVKEFVKSSK